MVKQGNLGKDPGLYESSAGYHGRRHLRAAGQTLVVLLLTQHVAVSDELQPRAGLRRRLYVLPVRLLGVPAETHAVHAVHVLQALLLVSMQKSEQEMSGSTAGPYALCTIRNASSTCLYELLVRLLCSPPETRPARAKTMPELMKTGTHDTTYSWYDVLMVLRTHAITCSWYYVLKVSRTHGITHSW